MTNQFNLNINTPCAENYDQFAPTPKGGFCGSCKKEVVDFTKMNPEDLIIFFKNKTTQNTCGRFNTDQLNRHIEKPKKNKRLSLLSGIGFACLAFFSSIVAQAQDKKKNLEPIENTSEIKGTQFEKNIIIKGTVKSGDQPLPGASIILEGTSVGIQTDFDGNFQFPSKLKVGDILIISSIGMASQKIIIENKKSALKLELKIDLQITSCVIMGKAAVKKVYMSNGN
jgi:hypothetical protein